MTNYRIDIRKLTVDEYQGLRGTTDWFTIEDRVVEKSVENDLFSVCILDKNELVGMGRIVGDGAIYFYIQDVIVIPEFQGRGIGRLIMKEIEKYLKENAFNNSFIGLMAADGVKEFYHKYEYAEREKSKPGMFKVIKK